MSKALNYLAATRPEAATHLLGFYKNSVKALDDKTRHLIQIVTKVTVGTERGLRQYAPKALKAGASKEEILDAVLMAFPAAGLPKVLDAIDILIELELLPELPSATPVPEMAEVRPLGLLKEFPLARMHCVHTPHDRYLVYRLDEERVKVYSAKCPHAKANLCKGVDHGDRVECKVHNWVFDLNQGDCLTHPDHSGLVEIPVTVRRGEVILT